jgi:serine/threonine-protein kinase
VTAPPFPTSAPPRLARRLADRYEVFDEIGRGGASVVYRAQERATGRDVAVKLVGSAAGDPAALARFAREAHVAGVLRHPNLVRTIEAAEWGGAAAFVMEYADGGTLRAALRAVVETGELWPYTRVIDVLRDLAAALAHAHEARVVHRDVKPENVFFDAATGRAMLADFGIAVQLAGAGRATSGGEAAGTPSYMAPEQIAGRPVDERTDVYALGLVGWELLTGRRPWEGEPLHRVLHRQQHEALAPLAALRPDIPAYLLTAVEGALAKNPRDRWRDGAEFLRRLSPTPAQLPAVVVPDAATTASATVRFTEPPAGGAPGRRIWRRVRREVRGAPRVAAVACAVVVGAVGVLVANRPGIGPRDWASRPHYAFVVAGLTARPPEEAAGAGRARPGRAVGPAPRAADAAPRATPPAAAPIAAPRRAAIPKPAASGGAVVASAAEAAGPGSSDTARRRLMIAEAEVARAYAQLADAMRRSAGEGREPRALQELRGEQERWEGTRARACGVGRDAACLAELAARKILELEHRRARFSLDGAPR